eukprot:COSAG03_NODE_3850_length_1795_cov_3.417453_1_plen_151_part_00
MAWAALIWLRSVLTAFSQLVPAAEMSARISTHSRSLHVDPPSPPPPRKPPLSSSCSVLLGPMPHCPSVRPPRADRMPRPVYSRCCALGTPLRSSTAAMTLASVSPLSTSSVSDGAAPSARTKICIRPPGLPARRRHQHWRSRHVPLPLPD